MELPVLEVEEPVVVGAAQELAVVSRHRAEEQTRGRRGHVVARVIFQEAADADIDIFLLELQEIGVFGHHGIDIFRVAHIDFEEGTRVEVLFHLPDEAGIDLEVGFGEFRRRISPDRMLDGLVSFAVIVRRLVAETIFNIDTELVLVEEERPRPGYYKRTVQRDIKAGGNEGTLGQRVVFVHPKARQHRTAYAKGSLRGV